jgi:uncharacterized protein (DUF697 family)
MSGPLKLQNLWRVIRDVDLEAVRRAAQERFDLAIVADAAEDADRLHALLSGDPTTTPPHPWISAAPTAEVERLPATPVTAILVTRQDMLSDPLRAARDRFSSAGVPIVTVVIGDTSPTAAVVRARESARVAAAELDGRAQEPVAEAVVSVLTPDQQMALAARLPPLRQVTFGRIIDETARVNAGFALTTGLAETIPVLTAPLNLGDIVVLTKNQLMMSYRIVLASGRDGDPRGLMTEIIGVLGGGVLFRQMARQLIGLIPIAGLLPKIAIAYAGTYAIGRAMVAWSTEGKQVTADSVNKYARDGLVRGRALAAHLAEQAGVGRSKAVRRWERLKRFLPGRGSAEEPAQETRS